MKRFNARVIELRKQGKKTAVGMAGNTYRRRVYAVLVVDEGGRIIAAERFGGWTVFARLKPMPFLVGADITEIDETPQFGIKPKLWQALRNSAHYIREYDRSHEEVARSTARKKGKRTAIALPTGWKVGGGDSTKDTQHKTQ